MSTPIYVHGSLVQPDPSNWQDIARQAIDDAMAKNPTLGNATQLAIMNAVKESAGVYDAASPFHSGGGSVAIANVTLPDWTTWPVVGPLSQWIADGIKNDGDNINAAKSTAQKVVAAVVAGARDSLPNLPTGPDWDLLIVVAGIAATGFLVFSVAKLVR